MGKYYDAALVLRGIMDRAGAMLTDEQALEVPGLYPRWKELVKLGSVTAEAGYRFTHNGKLYKCVNANPTFQETWVPGVGTESIYTRIDESHAGTLEDPIPYDGNMELVNGLYYSQDGVVYKCNRDTGVPVFSALADLVGIYVEVAA